MDIKVILKYMSHLPTCNKMQNWDEAYDAFANTPEKFRDHEYDLALQELDVKRNTCTCGLSTVMLHLEHQPHAEGSEAWVSESAEEIFDNVPMIVVDGKEWLSYKEVLATIRDYKLIKQIV